MTSFFIGYGMGTAFSEPGSSPIRLVSGGIRKRRKKRNLVEVRASRRRLSDKIRKLRIKNTVRG